jgi:rhodanese-related sulfurtransferase
MWRVFCLFGSRPELIVLAPLLRALDARRARIATLHVAACEDAAALRPLADELGVRIDRSLPALRRAPPLPGVAAAVLAGLDPLLERESPHLLIVQGNSAAALAGALSACLRNVPVAHVTAGSDAGEPGGPASVEASEGPITRLARLHCIAAPRGGALPLADDVSIRRAKPRDAGDTGERIAQEIERWLDTQPARTPGALPPAGGPRSLEDFVDAAKQSIEEITPEQARRILEAPAREGFYFVDVREPDEYAAGHIPGAHSFPRGFLEVRADLAHYKRDPWLEDRERKLILYCGGGHRSALAACTLQEMGFTNAVSMLEGWTGWTQRAYPVEK